MPNRILRDWTTSESMDSLTPEAEVFFTRLIMKADDYGSFHGNPKLIKSALFPLKDYTVENITAWLKQCVDVNLIITYKSDGKDYIRIENFGQRLRAMRSTFPQPAVNPLTSGGHTSANRRPETKRNEVETETEGEASASFDENFKNAFDEITCERYKMVYKDIDLGRELQLFRIKCDNDQPTYYHRDSAGLRTAFQYQLKSAKKNGQATKEHPAQAAARAFAERHGGKPS